MRDRLLFLDFDGVLHPNFCDPEDFFCLIPTILDSITAAPPDLKVVISSSWRFHHEYEGLKNFFPEQLQARLIGATGPAIAGRHARYREINAFLDKLPRRVEWRALDDAKFEFPDHCPELILCDGRNGILKREHEILVEWLRSNRP
ncbi:MAG: hypothetical protein A3G80_02390 [Betaproteobacteria bacterium RIFCSPLOWO2_12_FULL_62_13b]|nr:MAG: hypothetical protein A3G80_02390 [Betaproteobacteria bacterium RIFCSPLOWO2_12_FULL_62_13b]